MIKRIVEIANPAHLHLKLGQLVIERDRKEIGSVPLEDLGLLIIDHPNISHTHGLLSACCKNGAAVILSDEKHLPGSILLPLDGNNLQSKIVSQQAQVSEPVKKRLWQQITREKIQGQANVLKALKRNFKPVQRLVNLVRTGDPENIEGRAARIYWKLLFGGSFRRDPQLEGRNALLNYGYSIVRSAVARALVGAGLHPSLGLHHHNQYDSFCLADDVVEPLRPLVDLRVARITGDKDDDIRIDKDVKTALLELLSVPSVMGEQALPLMVALHRYAASLKAALCEGAKKLSFPKWQTEEEA